MNFLRSRSPSRPWFRLLLDEPGNADEDNGTQNCERDTLNEATRAKTEQANHPTSNHDADNSQEYVGDHAVSAPFLILPAAPPAN